MNSTASSLGAIATENEAATVFRQSVSEADIDWLFCIELNACDEFRQWVASQLFPGIAEFDHIQAWRSVSNVAGESDLLWLIESAESGRAIALIENKIAAAAQPGQYLRYVQRGEGYVDAGVCQRVVVALLAPAKYRSRDSREYPVQISYEDIIAWLRSREDARSQYLASVYEAGLDKLGTTAPVDEEISRFQERVWQLAKTEFPDLRVPAPKSVSASQYWVYMRDEGYTLIYKMYKKNGAFQNCVVDLELAGRGEEVDLLREKYRAQLAGTDITVVKTRKSASFRLNVPNISPLHFDEEKVRIALRAASKLKSWWDGL